MWLRVGIFLVLFIAEIIAENCITPNGEMAECISLYSCPTLTSALGMHQPASIEFVRKSNCGGTGSDPLVCCGSSSSFIEVKAQNTNTKSLLPDRSYCGYQHADDYVRPENSTTINEFPWLAGLLYKKNEDDSEFQVQCGGSLISNRYVLTAAHCVQFTSKAFNIVGVRLGEYNLKNRTDCIGEDSDLYECSEPPKEFGIEKIIVHPEYKPQIKANDIALLRLNRTTSYSDYIRPICLPTPGRKSAEIGDLLSTTGWGKGKFADEQAETKKKVFSKLISNDECAARYEKIRSIIITENQYCTKELDSNNEFSCHGDSGGPSMFSYRNQWQQEGIWSFTIGCRQGFPELYTKVANYLEWIKENIEL